MCVLYICVDVTRGIIPYLASGYPDGHEALVRHGVPLRGGGATPGGPGAAEVEFGTSAGEMV